MGNFNRDNRGGGARQGGRDFDRPRRDFGGDRGDRPQDRQMHSAVCSSCGKNCEVPFKPNGSKPIFCSDCFEKNGGGARRQEGGDRGPRRSFGSRDSRPARSFEPRSQQPQDNSKFDELNVKLDKIIRLLNVDRPREIALAQAESKSEESTLVKEEPAKKKTRAKKLVVAEEVEVPMEAANPENSTE